MARIPIIEEEVPRPNSEVAEENRGEFERHGLLVTTLYGAPGSGKTSLLERSIPLLARDGFSVGVITADLETDRDAQRIAALDAPVVQIVTGGKCHLEPRTVQAALHCLDLAQIDLLFIENVGSLACPLAYDLGEHLRVVVMSTTEGEHIPLKYPAVFKRSDALLITKTDLLPFLAYDLEQAKDFALRVNMRLRIFQTASPTGHGIQAWLRWVLDKFRRTAVTWRPIEDKHFRGPAGA